MWLELVQGSRVSLHTLLLAVGLQLLFACEAWIGAGLLCEPAHIAARCVLAAVGSLRGLIGAGLLCEPTHVAARCVLAAVVCLCGLNWCRALERACTVLSRLASQLAKVIASIWVSNG